MMTKEYVLPMVFMLIVDYIWITINKTNYVRAFSKVQCGQPVNVRIIYAAVVYLFMYMGFIMFILPIVKSTRKHNQIEKLVFYSASFGAIVYGVFNFTNMALLQNYGIWIGIMDTVWGAVLYSITSCLLYFMI